MKLKWLANHRGRRVSREAVVVLPVEGPNEVVARVNYRILDPKASCIDWKGLKEDMFQRLHALEEESEGDLVGQDK